MFVSKNLVTPLGLAATAVLALGVVGASPAGASPSAAGATVIGDTLVITGGNGPDRVTVDFRDASSVGVELDGDRQSFERRAFRVISVSLGSGDDRFDMSSGGSASADVPLHVDAGNGDDTVVGGAGADTIVGGNGDDNLRGGAGADVLFGDNGDDFADGGVGTDTEVLGAGDDVAGWTPGEGSDAVFGQSGSDTLAFDGSGGDEVMSLSRNGTDAVFLRSPGAVRMDLDGVERVEANALGGVDAVTINDLRGTDVQDTTVDLSSGGTGDGKADTVVVNGSPAADDVAVGVDSGAVDIRGLQPLIRIKGSESIDRLHLNTLGGKDQVRVSDAAKSLIGILVDFGADQ